MPFTLKGGSKAIRKLQLCERSNSKYSLTKLIRKQRLITSSRYVFPQIRIYLRVGQPRINAKKLSYAALFENDRVSKRKVQKVQNFQICHLNIELYLHNKVYDS